jgi:hypothetical protein
MKIYCFLIALLCSNLIEAQLKKSIEISASLNTVDEVFISQTSSYFGVSNLTGGDLTKTNVALGLQGKYFIADNTAFCLKIMYEKRNEVLKNEIFDPYHSRLKYQISQPIFKIAPGIQWSFPIKKLVFTGGFDLPVTFFGALKTTSIENRDVYAGNPKIDLYSFNEFPSGTAIGLGVFTGLQYYIVPKMAIGFNLGTAYQYTLVKGKVIVDNINISTTREEQYVAYNQTVKEFGFAGFQGSIAVTFKLK